MKKIALMLGFAMLTALLVFTSCKKDEDEQKLDVNETTKNIATTDGYWDAIDTDIDFVSDMMESNNFKSVLDSCPTIIVEHPDSVFFPRTITVDYGEEYCETWHGRLKKGKIIIHITSAMHLEGSVRTVTLEDFHIDEHKIEGIKTLINKGFNDAGNMNFDATLEDGQISFPDGAISTRVNAQNREWTTGIETPRYWWDNEWLIRGTVNGEDRGGIVYSYEINEPVLVKSVCRFPVSGTIDMIIADFGIFVFDYGDGDCDNIGTITGGDEVWEIILGRNN